MTQTHADLLINARWIAPVVPHDVIYADCALAIGDGRILGIHPRAEAARRYSADQVISLDNHVLMPGLVNAHGHSAMNLLRGFADDHPLGTWLEQHIWPAEDRWVGEEFVRDGTELAMAEMIRTGTTCFADMYFFPDQVASLARHHGMRCQITFPVIDMATAWARNGDEYIHKGLALYDEYRDSDLIRMAFGPHAPYTVSDTLLKKIATLAPEVDLCVQIHLHETEKEVQDSLEQTGMRPIDRLHQFGLLTASTQCVHMTALDGNDIQLLADTGAHVVHCPKSNLKLGSGFCPVNRLREASVNVALGTDGAASNNSLDMFSEMQFATLLAKGTSGDAAALDAHATLRMATIDGARALGMDSDIGSLEAGKSADLIAVNLDDLHQQPVYNPLSALLYTQSGHRVSHLWIRGQALMTDHQLLSFNHHELQARARLWQQRIADTA